MAVVCVVQDTLRDDCDNSEDCVYNCCVSPVVAPVFFVVFVLAAQFVLVNVVVAVLMKHLEVPSLRRQIIFPGAMMLYIFFATDSLQPDGCVGY